MVWCGIINQDLVGPYFFDRNVDSEAYLELLGDFVIPQLILNGYNPAEVWYQHDGAPAHRSLVVQDWLNNNFDNWIGHGGTLHWPARSPDLNPLDFFLWGYVRDNIYRTRSHTIDELKTKIQEKLESIPQVMLSNVADELERRIILCKAAEGHHFEHCI